MDFLKRAFISVTRRKNKTILLIILFSCISVFILAGMSIKNATLKTADLARQKLGSSVTLTLDNQKMREEMRNSEETNSLTERPKLSTETADVIAYLDHVISYNYLNTGYAYAEDFEPVSLEEESVPESGFNAGLPRMGGRGGMSDSDAVLTGTLFSEGLDDFINGNNILIEGRHITEDDVDSNVVLVEKALAKLNGLTMGQMITLSNSDGDTMEFEIVGIYETSSAAEDTAFGGSLTALNPSNNLIIPNKAANLFGNGSEEGTIDRAVYYLDDPLNVDEFKASVENSGIDMEYLMLDANDNAYMQMVGSIESIGSIADIIVYLVSITGTVILALILILSIKERNYEIGVLLSIGESKLKIIGQLLMETIIIAILAFGIASFVGDNISQGVSDMLLQNEISASAETAGDNHNDFNNFGGRPVFGRGSMAEYEEIDELDVAVTSNELANTAALGSKPEPV